jgi:threonine synthase
MKSQNPSIKNKANLGEGNTPLVRLKNLEKYFKYSGELWAKMECMNPTGSFKDRGSVYEITATLRARKKGVVCASTGNMAASLAAYAAQVGLKCIVVVPKNTPRGKLFQAEKCGAKIVEVNGNYDMCVTKAKKLSEKYNFLLCGDYKTRRFGQRSLGVELTQCGIEFDAFIVPVGNGTLACAIFEGLKENSIKIPMIGVQGKGADPLVRTWNSQSNEIIPLLKPTTSASAMNVGNPLDGKLTLSFISESGGFLLSVSDTEMKKYQNLLAKKEGIFIELSGAATIAALPFSLSKFPKKSKMVLIFTGNGLKELNNK